ncbi:protein of unknown function [Burkholderia multivorans]
MPVHGTRHNNSSPSSRTMRRSPFPPPTSALTPMICPLQPQPPPHRAHRFRGRLAPPALHRPPCADRPARASGRLRLPGLADLRAGPGDATLVGIAVLAHVVGQLGDHFRRGEDDLIEIEARGDHFPVERLRENPRHLIGGLRRFSDDLPDRLVRGSRQRHLREARAQDVLQLDDLDRFRDHERENREQLQVVGAEARSALRLVRTNDADHLALHDDRREHPVAARGIGVHARRDDFVPHVVAWPAAVAGRPGGSAPNERHVAELGARTQADLLDLPLGQHRYRACRIQYLAGPRRKFAQTVLETSAEFHVGKRVAEFRHHDRSLIHFSSPS